MQTFDPRIYAVGECGNHRGVAYGLVAPLYEMAKVCANHLAAFGIGRYQGSITSTKLKVTGIDLFSAGDFVGSDGTEHITLSDPVAGVYKKLVLKDEKLVGAVLYGDTVDGAYYFKLLREGRSIMDTVNEEAKRFGSRMGAADRDKLDEYFTSVRELEQRIRSKYFVPNSTTVRCLRILCVWRSVSTSNSSSSVPKPPGNTSSALAR